MAYIRRRGNRYYWRCTIRDQNGKRHWIERGGYDSYEEAVAAIKVPKAEELVIPFEMTEHLAEMIFARFPEKHPAHIPLKLMYYTGCTLEEAYDIRIDDVDFENERWKDKDIGLELTNLLRRQLNRILQARIIFLYPDSPKYFNIYFSSGKKVDKSQIYYITHVIRKELNPGWRRDAFKCTTSI